MSLAILQPREIGGNAYMTELLPHQRKKLEDAGLAISEPRGSGDQHRYQIWKRDEQEEETIDSQTITVLTGYVSIVDSAGAQWSVFNAQHSGGVGVADFANLWHTADDAVADLLDFYRPGSLRHLAKEVCARLRRDAAPDAVSAGDVLEALRSAGLHVSSGAPVLVYRGGKVRTSSEAFVITNPARDASRPHQMSLRLYPSGDCWMVDCRTLYRFFGHGEFNHIWCTAEEVVNDVLDFWSDNDLRWRALRIGLEQQREHPLTESEIAEEEELRA
jgi:hypothetical protein